LTLPRAAALLTGMAPEPALRARKREFRAQLRLARTSLGGAARAELSRRITEHVLALPAWQEAKTVMLYLSLPEEVDTEALIQEALDRGKRLCVPRIQRDGTMEAVHVESLAGVAMAGLKIAVRQPIVGLGTELDPAEIDLNLAPCVGVDRTGMRLGLGGGHYDRFLAAARPDALALGLIFSCQLVDTLPCDERDRRLSGYVTEEGLTMISYQ
jgi:5-formyltetrahydrofolate cyclo-ligase